MFRESEINMALASPGRVDGDGAVVDEAIIGGGVHGGGVSTRDGVTRFKTLLRAGTAQAGREGRDENR